MVMKSGQGYAEMRREREREWQECMRVMKKRKKKPSRDLYPLQMRKRRGERVENFFSRSRKGRNAWNTTVDLLIAQTYRFYILQNAARML